MVNTERVQHLGSRVMGLMSAAALAGLCLFGAPAPTAQAAENCSFNWGIKESWRGYIQKKVFEGTWEKSSGVGFTGDKTGPDGAFVFTPKKATIDGSDSATIPMQGSLHFQSHKSKNGDFYLLDMKIYDIRVKASGSTAEIIADYDSYTWDGDINATELGEKLKGDDEVLATITLNNPVDTDSGTVDLSGEATATAGTKKLFIADNYAAGESMDPTSGVVKLDGSCASSGGSTSSGSGGGSRVCGANFGRVNGEFTGANKEIMGMLSELNDTIGAVDLLMCNSTNLKNSVEEFTGVKSSTGGSKSSGGNSGGSGSGSESGGSGSGDTSSDADATSGAGSGSGSVSGDAGGGSGDAGTASTSDVCSASGAKGVKSATTSWGIKKSFQSYITGSIAKGKWTLSGIKHQNGQFVFPGNSGAVDPSAKKGTIGSTGGVQFVGHNGLLNLQITNPEIQFDGNQGKLIASVRSSDTSGKKTNYGRVTVANLKFTSLSVSDSQASGKASVFLTQAGAKAFAGFYEPGLELDPISFNAKLGASANCASGQGGAAASTAGGDSDSSGPSAAELLNSDDSSGSADAAFGDDAENTTEGYENGQSKFKIKSSAANEAAGKGVGGTGLDPSAYVLLAAAALLLAGGSLGRLVLSHPA